MRRSSMSGASPQPLRVEPIPTAWIAGSAVDNLGGWAYLLVDDGVESIVSGQLEDATAPRAILTAAFKAVGALPRSVQARLITSASFLVEACRGPGGLAGWLEKQKRPNSDLWLQLLVEIQFREVAIVHTNESSDLEREQRIHVVARHQAREGAKKKTLGEHNRAARARRK